MYGMDDVVRSVRRTVAEMLGPPWNLDLERREVPDDERPAGLIEPGAPSRRPARTSIPQGNVVHLLPLTVTLYPSLEEPRISGRTARQLAQGLEDLAAYGTEGPVFQDGRPASGPERWPLYDYVDVPLEGTPEERRGPAFPHDVMWLEDAAARTIQDVQDPTRWTVVLDVRVSWEAPGRVGPPAPIVRSMPGGYMPRPLPPAPDPGGGEPAAQTMPGTASAS